MTSHEDEFNPFNELARFFQEMQKHLIESIQNGTPLDNPQIKHFGFSIHVGPDGVPHFAPIHGQAPYQAPFVDIFFNEGTYQIVAEVPGIEDKEEVTIEVKDQTLDLVAEHGEYRYRTTIQLKHKLDDSTLKYDVRNGVLEIFIQSK